MKELIIITLLFLTSIIQAQSFQKETKEITHRIDSITLAEKSLLKKDISQIDKALEEGNISYEEAEHEKNRLAEYYASRIELGVNHEKEKLESLISRRVNNQIAGNVNDTIDDDESKKYEINIKRKKDKDKWTEPRTTSQFVFAVGVNSLQSDNSELGDALNLWNSRFWEFGYTMNTRLNRESNLLHLKYGLSLLYNNYRPEGQQIFEALEQETILVDSPIDYKKYRFRNFYVNVPVHFEFDFSPMKLSRENEKLYRSHQSFRIGMGGYFGVLVNSKSFLKYKKDGSTARANKKGEYHVNPFNYGLSAYVGYKQLSLYTKYDLKPVFEHNAAEDYNFSVGLRWDFN